MRKLSPFILILLGSFSWILTMWKSGQTYTYGVGFWGPHGHDAIWHLSLINSLTSGHLSLPMFAGESLKNYHFGYDAMTAVLVRLTGISASVYYFQILPILFSLAIGYLVYYLTRNLWSVYLTYFATGLGWIIGKGESTFWAQQAISTLINPPYALSLIFLLLGFIYLKRKNYLLTAIFFGTVGFIKIYAGILGIFTMLFFAPLVYTVLSVIFSLVLFLPFNNLNNHTLIFQPFWFIQNLFSDPTRLYSSRMFNYLHSTNFLKSVPAAILGLLIFLVGNLGIRALGFFKSHKLFLPLIFLGLLFPVFFVQSGTTWNTIQFMYYSMFFLALSAGKTIHKLPIYYSLLLLLFTLPAVPATLSQYLPSRPPAAIPNSETQALEFLKKQPPGIVLVPLYDKNNFSKFAEPRPLFAYESTAYVSAYSHHPVFLEDEVNLKILNIDISSRQKIISEIFSSFDSTHISSLITQNQIKYIYLPNIFITAPKISAEDFGFTLIYSLNNTQIWTNTKYKLYNTDT